VGALPPAPAQIGDQAPDIDLVDSAGESLIVPDGRPRLFVSGPLADAMGLAERLSRRGISGHLSLILLLPEPVNLISDAGDVFVAVDPEHQNASALGLTPALSVVLVSADQVIASEVLHDNAAILELVERSAAAVITASRLRKTTPVSLGPRP
jgi:hypothetical protein